MLTKITKITFLAICIASGGWGLAQASPLPQRPPVTSDDDLRREERDAKYMMQLQVKSAEDMAKGQARLREEQERAATAMRKLYEGMLEQQYQESGGFQDAEALARAIQSADQGGAQLPRPSSAALPRGGMVMPGQTMGGTPVQQPLAPQTQKPGQGMGTEASRALDALALEDGPEVARKYNLGFVPMGTIAEVRLITAVSTAIPGVVVGQLIHDLYDIDTRCVVIPRGSKVIGNSAQMGSDTEARGKVVFHTFVDPGGRVIPIATPVVAANRIGITGLDGKVDYHWAKMLGGSVALAVISAFAGNNTAAVGNQDIKYADIMKQNVSQNIGQGGQQLLQRFTQIKPDIHLEEGSVAKVIFVSNLMAKPYRMLAAVPLPSFNFQGSASFRE